MENEHYKKPYFAVEMKSLGGFVFCVEYEEPQCKIVGLSTQAFCDLYLNKRDSHLISTTDYKMQWNTLLGNMIAKIKKTDNDSRTKKSIYFYSKFDDVLNKKR